MEPKSLLPSTWEVPELFRHRIGSGPGRQRAMFAEGHLLLVLHAPPKADQEEREGRLFWRAPDGTWTTNERGAGQAAIERHLNEFADAIEELEQRENSASAAEDYFGVVENLAPIQRSTKNLHQVFQDARQLAPDIREIINYRDRAYNIERTAELLYNVAKTGLDFAIARRAEEQAQASQKMATASHRLNILVAFFFPLATLTSLFGTNLKNGLEEMPGPWPFMILLAGGLVSGAILTAFITSSRNKP